MEVRARAPGKIILSGEHAVVHGSTAVAAAIDLHTQMSFSPDFAGDGHESVVVIELKDVALVFAWPLEHLKEKLPNLELPCPSSPRICCPETLKSISLLVEEQNVPEAKIWVFAGLCAFLHLYTSIQGFRAGKVTVNSSLPLGSGLGSSASFCVSLSAALLATSGAVSLNSHPPDWLTLADKDLELVNRWAFEGEKILHGRPSGLDNTVSTFGRMLAFKLGEITHIKCNVPLRMLITNTKVGRNTKALVAGVSERAIRHPDAMTAVFSAVDSISKELCTVIQMPTPDDLSITEKEEKLEELIEMNQGLLQCMGVSHSSIETVLRTTLKYKLTSKLTGAGGGGCVLTLLPTLLSATVVEKVIDELHACGFQCFTAQVGGEGLQICVADSPKS